jgi:hypothetical protein
MGERRKYGVNNVWLTTMSGSTTTLTRAPSSTCVQISSNEAHAVYVLPEASFYRRGV